MENNNPKNIPIEDDNKDEQLKNDEFSEYDENENVPVQSENGNEQKERNEVRQNFKSYTKEKFVEIMSDDSSIKCDELCRCIASMSDEQLQIIFPLMTNERIKKAIPQLQLQQQGVAVLSLNPEKIRVAVSAITHSDKQILLQNISLLTMSESKASENEELQSIIGFIDPLAMAVAAENPKLVEKVIEACCIMTIDQIKVLVPLLNGTQVKQVLEVIDSDKVQKVMLTMTTEDQRTEIIKSLTNDLEYLRKKVSEDIEPLLAEKMEDKLKDLELKVKKFCEKDANDIREGEYIEYLEILNEIKKRIEGGQKDTRNLQNKVKVPMCILDKSNEKLLEEFSKLSIKLTDASSKLLQQYQIIDKGNLKDGLIHSLNEKWELIKDKVIVEKSLRDSDLIDANDSELIFMDCDSSAVLYEAIKSIGNPAAIGEIYNITWNEIIEFGFRTEEDFKRHKISTLKELEEHIAKLKVPKAVEDSGEAVLG